MKRLILTTCLFVLFASCTALAHWEEGDSYKMHFPQLPDPDGWDVAFSDRIPQLADDWECSEDGYVDDVHIWYSWEKGIVGTIDMVQLSIWSDDDGGGVTHSKPDTILWDYRNFLPGTGLDKFTIREYGKATNQGWYDPNSGFANPEDHFQSFQLNIEEITDPFEQEEGDIYWLSVCFYTSGDPNAGWKTSENHFRDDAVWWDPTAGTAGEWKELRDPITGESLDLAFVITPEPATLSLLGLGSLVLLRKRRAQCN